MNGYIPPYATMKLINQNLERQMSTLYDDWFLQFDFPNFYKPYASSDGELIWNNQLKQKMPASWQIKNIKDIASITWGQCPEGANILNKSVQGKDLLDYCSGAGDMKGGFLVDCQAKTDASRRLAHDNDILISIAGKIGDICVVDHTISIGRAAMAFTAKNKNEVPFIYMLLKKMNAKLCTIASGSIQKVINGNHIDELFFPYSFDTVNLYCQISSHMFYEMKKLCCENRMLLSLREYLSPKFMSGQIAL